MAKLTQGSVKRTLFTMAFPMLAGTIAMNAYNLADTWFVSRLGTLPLAAMGFTFPVVMLLTFIAGSIGTGVTTLTSHAIGRHDQTTASRIVSHGFAFTILVAFFMSIAGYLSIEPVFRLLGADDLTLPLISDYMKTWYVGAVFMALPMMGNGILIASGDSRSASSFMMLGVVLNVILDPIMIFGWFGFPALGMFGAALATVIAQAIASLRLFYLLNRKHRLLGFNNGAGSSFIFSCRQILEFAVPAGFSMMLMPVSAAIITSLLSSYGHEAVAASGAASRIEMIAFVIPMALGMSMTPFISQNLGAGRMDRIIEAKNLASAFAIIYGFLIAIVFYLSATLLAGIFTEDPLVSSILTKYIKIISWGYGMMEVHRYSGFVFTGMHRPFSSTALNALRVLVLLIPLSFAGSHFFGITGIFAGRLITDLTVGTFGLIWVSRVLTRESTPGKPVPTPVYHG
ncbi:MAG TPA: MATE family efflux transporter [Candidatus Rifleibacterium sp.]|nr:MATE family efflux transporter [Candidatus Rifleibacterium sp.]HPT46896.1 MATE family efflux transporter [Candidatus Rifleibacterium sp.]